MEEAQGFVRYTHRRCPDCDIREDLHASGTAIPKRRHRIVKCQTCNGSGEIPLSLKEGADPYRGRTPAGRPQIYEARRAKRAHSERHRFRATTYLFDICELLMQIPPGGFNHGRTKSEDGTWKPLESEGKDGDVQWPPSFKKFIEPLNHGTRYAYQKAKCRCFACRRWNSELSRRLATPIGRGQVESARVNAGEVFSQESRDDSNNATTEAA